MRITGGTLRGRRLTAPKSGMALIRPTCDRVREAMFNIVGDRVRGSAVLDLFAGTGAIGIEALSRGAAFTLFVDQSAEAGRLIAANLRACFSRPPAAFLQLRLSSPANLRNLAQGTPPLAPFDLIFMDPPYQKNLAEQALRMVEEAQILAPDGLVLVEEHRRVQLPDRVGDLAACDRRRYGETGLWIFAPGPS